MMTATVLPSKSSYPMVVNYGRKEYGAGAQNWAAAQVPDGTMLFGNHYGLLTFNSRNWDLHGINYGSVVRSVSVDKTGRKVYAGGSNEFGYFITSATTNKVEYHSLIETLPETERSFGEIWKIMQSGRDIWLQADHLILRYDGKRTQSIKFDKKITSSALSNNTLYIGFDDGTLSRLDIKDALITPTGITAGSRICSLVPLPGGNILVVTSLQGLFIYDHQTLSPCMHEVSEFIKANQAFCATYHEGVLAIGTVHCGAVTCHIDGSDAAFINKSTGLQNNTVLNAAFDNTGNLWLCLDNGIACVAAISPIRNLLGNNDDYGAGYASLVRGNKMLLGTNQGLYTIPWPGTPSATTPTVNRLISGQIWAIDTIGKDLFICGDLGLYLETGGAFRLEPEIRGATSITPLRHTPGYAIVGTYGGFHLMHNESGVWRHAGKIGGYNDATNRPVEDVDGTLWVAHWQKGLYRLTFDTEKCRFNRVRLYTSRDGLPSDRDNTVQKIGDDLIFSTVNGFYMYDKGNDTLKPNISLNPQIGSLPTSRLYRSPTNDLWIVGWGRVMVVRTNLVGETRADSVTYRSVGSKLIPGSENLNFVSPTRLVAGHEEGFFDIDLTARRDSTRANPVFISALYANQDSLLYAPELFLPPHPEIQLPYALNSVRFEFVAPYYQSSGEVLYSVHLEGRSDEWSQFSPLASKEYTDLHEGEYTFQVKAFNRMTGSTSECSFKLKVLPPWYRTAWAYTIYVLAGLAALYFIYRIYVRNTRHAAYAMERRKNEELAALESKNKEESMRKDYEIARLKSQQLEQDIKNKSNELSNSTLNLVRKNEILLDISARLTKLNESLVSQPEGVRHTKAIAKIKELIRENISHDDDWKTFTRNFDLVYENYMQRLLEKYPTLTITDQRLCAYIKMGLSSKEIAPLLNITYRSVEMNRYRLRKKIQLPTEQSLSDYLRKF